MLYRKTSASLFYSIGTLFALLTLPVTLCAQQYQFVKIADTSSMFSNLTPTSGGATVNADGIVGFAAQLSAGGSGIYSGDGNTVHTLYDTTQGFDQFLSSPVLNANGDFAFAATPSSAFGVGYYKSSGGTLTTLSLLTNGIIVFGPPSINDQGAVAFNSGDMGVTSDIYRADGTTLTTIVHNNGMMGQISLASLNANGDVAFRTAVTNQAIYLGNGGPLTTLYTAGGQFSGFGPVVLNAQDEVAFRGILTSGVRGIFLGNGGTATTIADNTQTFSSFGLYVGLNVHDEAAFIGNLTQGGSGIFTGSDPVADRVIGTGDSLFGETISSLDFFRDGLNDAGQIAFHATFTDGSQGIFLANPLGGASVPEPSSIVLLLSMALPGAGFLVRRRTQK